MNFTSITQIFMIVGFKSLVMVAFVFRFFNPESRKIFVKGVYFVIIGEKKIAHCIGYGKIERIKMPLFMK